MRIPSSINRNCLTVYEPNENYAKRWSSRKIKSFNIRNWDDNIPHALRELCIECISKNWKEFPLLDEILLLEDRYMQLDLLSENLPLHLTIPKIDEEMYWKRCFINRWPNKLPNVDNTAELTQIVKNEMSNNAKRGFSNKLLIIERNKDLSNDDDESTDKEVLSRRSSRNSSKLSCREDNKDTTKRTWKKSYIEMHVKEYIENLRPENYEPEKFKELCDLCGTSVEILHIDQMLASENSSNKIPLSSILTGFTNLQELCICFKQTYASEDFSWNIINTPYQDIRLFARGLEKIRLKTLRITNSDIDCEKAIIVLKAVLKHELDILDFSHCKIGDRGMMAISKFLLENPVREMLLPNNRIGPDGITSLAYGLSQASCSIKILDLKLNSFFNDAANLLMKCISKNNKTLISLSISGCGISKFEVATLLKTNKCLESLDISNNRLSEDPAVLKDWNKAIPRDDRIFCPNNVVCSLHGIKREKPRLKEGSVPSKFPNLPFYLSNSRKRRKPPCIRTESTEVKKKKANK